jgi:hypothetical protein
MFERFTDRGRRVLVLAQEEARRFNHNYIGTEHILLGLVREEDGTAAEALRSLGATLGAVRAYVEENVGVGGEPFVGSPAFTTGAKRVLELSLRESQVLGHGHISTEHILLGLVRVGEQDGQDVAARVLVALDADLPSVRSAVLDRVRTGGRAGPDQPDDPSSPLSAVPLIARRPYWSRTPGRWAVRPVLAVPLRAVIWGAAVRVVTRARWRTCLASGAGLALGSVVVEGRVHRRRRPRHWDLGLRGGAGPAPGRRTGNPASSGLVASPGGWLHPVGTLPMWDWAPPGGGQPRLDRVPWAVRAWYEVPFLDRYAHAWMWGHGGWDVTPPVSASTPDVPY